MFYVNGVRIKRHTLTFLRLTQALKRKLPCAKEKLVSIVSPLIESEFISK